VSAPLTIELSFLCHELSVWTDELSVSTDELRVSGVKHDGGRRGGSILEAFGEQDPHMRTCGEGREG